MKKYFVFSFIFVFSLVFLSCEDNERFSGSPIGNQEIITLDAVVSTSATFALTNQEIDFTVTLPRTFADTVKVEATSISNSGRRTRAYVDVLPNQLTASGKINAAGGGIYNTSFNLFLSAIELFTVEQGKHYLIKSNSVQVNTGSTTIQDPDGRRLSIKLVWENLSSSNNLRFNIVRPGASDANVTSLSGGKTHYINVDNSGTASTNNSYLEGEYVINITALSLTTSPIDMPYRLVLVHPNGKVEVFNGVYSGLTVGAPLLPILKVTKTGNLENAVFTAAPL